MPDIDEMVGFTGGGAGQAVHYIFMGFGVVCLILLIWFMYEYYVLYTDSIVGWNLGTDVSKHIGFSRIVSLSMYIRAKSLLGFDTQKLRSHRLAISTIMAIDHNQSRKPPVGGAPLPEVGTITPPSAV